MVGFCPLVLLTYGRANLVLAMEVISNLLYFRILTRINEKVGVRDTLEQIDVAKRLIELYSDDVCSPPFVC